MPNPPCGGGCKCGLFFFFFFFFLFDSPEDIADVPSAPGAVEVAAKGVAAEGHREYVAIPGKVACSHAMWSSVNGDAMRLS